MSNEVLNPTFSVANAPNHATNAILLIVLEARGPSYSIIAR